MSDREQYEKAIFYYNRKNYILAVKEFEKIVNCTKDSEYKDKANLNLGKCYMLGDSVLKDSKKASEIFLNLSSKSSYVQTQLHKDNDLQNYAKLGLAKCYEQDLNYKEAFRIYYELSNVLNSAKYELAHFYKEGSDGVTKNKEEAVKLYKDLTSNEEFKFGSIFDMMMNFLINTQRYT
ncbi:15911_t:CDS:2 [Gigaspora margarita]|uniref:15911_t:CDS:1 n=1 Tax=Gigaspora margarita TaxID=4874 RepID=A0ABM8VZS4_GIGMA|nr:15911_t:CDS:2 [Gigaspora margarita]